MKIRIHVTKEILEKTKSCKTLVDRCAVSEAVREIFPRACTIYSTMHPFAVSDKNLGPVSIDLPPEATQFIVSFDRALSDDHRASMQPLSFDIDVPDSVIERIGITELDRILSESKTLERV